MRMQRHHWGLRQPTDIYLHVDASSMLLSPTIQSMTKDKRLPTIIHKLWQARHIKARPMNTTGVRRSPHTCNAYDQHMIDSRCLRIHSHTKCLMLSLPVTLNTRTRHTLSNRHFLMLGWMYTQGTRLGLWSKHTGYPSWAVIKVLPRCSTVRNYTRYGSQLVDNL